MRQSMGICDHYSQDWRHNFGLRTLQLLGFQLVAVGQTVNPVGQQRYPVGVDNRGTN